MAEGMTEERLKEIEASSWLMDCIAVRELLAEVRRLRPLEEAERIKIERGWFASREVISARSEEKKWIVRECGSYKIVGRLGKQLIFADTPSAAIRAADEWLQDHEKGSAK